ncbi:DUF1178 family protein [Pontivivens ytuae]|uniref:DUF1178 family protein n=1 Tax=Pontivivens ytuae TaxID=2789856 RepID=A0A7S9LUD1_9RHOB|nr:DUF1178 family protein [Pontivivens ytuae]QPH55331.1 DUF1178 family protein [Pontivivens ytuae]
MIRYSLKCRDAHDFESWFANSETFDTLAAGGHVACPVCGSTEVEKAVMAPRVATREAAPLSKPASPAEQAIAELRKKVEAESDYVGRDFAAEARRIHEGEADERAIWGEASGKEAKALVEDGVPVMPLPFGPRRTN